MNVKTPKDVTRATHRALEQLRAGGVDAKYTQVLSAIAAFHGFSNREEFLASIKGGQPSKPATAPSVQNEVLDGARPEPMSQAQLLEVVAGALDRIAQGEDFNAVCEDTGVTALVSEQRALLRADTTIVEPRKKETFLQRVLRMTPAEITHADFRMVVGALRRAFDEIRELRGHAPGWMLPYITVAGELNSEAEKLALHRAYPYRVVSYASAEAFRLEHSEMLVLARDLAESVREMQRRLDENPEVFGCAAWSTDMNHRYYSMVRGIDGNYRELPDGLTVEVPGPFWDAMCEELAGHFEGNACPSGYSLREIAAALESRLCRRAGDESADFVLAPLGRRTRKAFSCAELYAVLKATRSEVADRLSL